MAGYPPTPPPPGPPGPPPQGPYGPQDPYGAQQGYGHPQQDPYYGQQQGYPQPDPYGAPQGYAPQQGAPQNPYVVQQPYGPPGGGPPGMPGGPGPPYPNQPPRRTGAIIGVIAGGLALLLIGGGVVAWVLTRPSPAYAALPSCDDVVTNEVTEITGQRDPEIDEYVFAHEEFPSDADRDLEEIADCGVFEDETAGYASDEYLAIGLARHTSDSVDDGYESVRGEVEDKESGTGLDDRLDEVTSPETISVGDTGFQYIAEFKSEYDETYGEENSTLSFVEFVDRNLIVTIWYRAPDRVGDEEKRTTSLEVADELAQTIPDVTDVEE